MWNFQFGLAIVCNMYPTGLIAIRQHGLMQQSASCHKQHKKCQEILFFNSKNYSKYSCRIGKREDCNEFLGRFLLLLLLLVVQFNMPAILIKCFTTLLGHCFFERQPKCTVYDSTIYAYKMPARNRTKHTANSLTRCAH